MVVDGRMRRQAELREVVEDICFEFLQKGLVTAFSYKSRVECFEILAFDIHAGRSELVVKFKRWNKVGNKREYASIHIA